MFPTRFGLWLVCVAGVVGVGAMLRETLVAEEPTLAPPATTKTTELLPAPGGRTTVPPKISSGLGTDRVELPTIPQVPGAGKTLLAPPTNMHDAPIGESVPFEQAPGILIVPLSARKIAAYSAEGGGWKGYESPENMHVVPVSGEKIVAFTSVASEVNEVVCFSGPRGDFHRHGITRSPGPVEPSVTSCLAWYQIPAGIVAYSALTNSWGDLPIKSPLGCEIHHSDTLLTVLADGRLYAFSAKTGRWDTLELPQR